MRFGKLCFRFLIDYGMIHVEVFFYGSYWVIRILLRKHLKGNLLFYTFFSRLVVHKSQPAKKWVNSRAEGSVAVLVLMVYVWYNNRQWHQKEVDDD